MQFAASARQFGLRSMQPEEAATLVALEKERPYPWSQKNFLDAFANPSNDVLIWDEVGELKGFAVVQILGEEAYVTNFLIHPELRNKTLGQQLLQKIFSWSLYQGVKQVMLDVDSQNGPAIHLYKKMGFTLLQTRQKAYPRGESALVMKKSFLLILLGILFLGQGFLNAATTGNEESPYTYYLKALVMESQGNLQGSEEELDKALSLEPDSAYLNHMSAELSFFLGKLPKAKDAIEKVLTLKPDDTKAFLLAGQIYWSMGDVTTAEKKLRKAVQLSPDDSQPLVSLAMAVTSRDPEEAIKLYKNFLDRNPDQVEVRERLGQLYRNKGDLSHAKETWEKALQYSQDSLRAHLALAQIAEVNNDTATAISHYEAVLEKDPNNLPLLLRVGELRYRNNEMTEALKAFSKANEIAPNSASANFWMALLHENQGEWKEAVALLKKVAEKSPETGVMLRLSYYYTQLGQHKNAIAILDNLAKAEPENTDFLNYLAIAYEQDKQYTKSIQCMLKLTELDDQNPEYRFYLATLYDRTKQFPKAEEQLKRAILIKPDYAVALNYLGYSLADQGLKLTEAEEYIGRALITEPDNGAYLDSMGWVAFKMGQYRKAEDFLQRSLLKAQDPLVWEHFGDVRQAQGNLAQAILAWDESLHLKTDQKELRKKSSNLLASLNDHKKLDLFIKRMTANFGDLKSVKSLVQISVCDRHPCIDGRGEFLYEANQQTRIEIPGPLAGPLLLITKPYGKPVQYGALNPIFNTVEYDVTRAVTRIESLLTADAFRQLDLASLDKNIQNKGGQLVASNDANIITFKNKDGFIQQIEWHDAKSNEILTVRRYDPIVWPSLPLELEWRDVNKNFSIRFVFKNPICNVVNNTTDKTK